MPGVPKSAIARAKAPPANRNSIFPPKGCSIWGLDGEKYGVATGQSQKCLYEESLLIESSKFDTIITELVRQSGTLKAWFAFRLSILERRAGESPYTSASFAPVLTLIEESSEMWLEQHNQCDDHAGTWELGEPNSIIELQARVLFLLYRNIQDNHFGDLQHVSGLKWHPYYCEEAGRYLLLHRFLMYVNKHTSAARSMSIYPHRNVGVQQKVRKKPWEKTPGFELHQMAKRFSEDNGWRPRRLIGFAEIEEEQDQGHSDEEPEEVTFIIASDEEEEMWKIAKSALSRGNGYDQDLCDLMNGLLKWPKSYVKINGVSFNAGGNDNTLVHTLDELRHLMEDENSVFQLHVAGKSLAQAVDQPEPASQRDYRTHWAFKLEELTSKLSCDGQDKAEHLLALLRRNHRLSKHFIQDLMSLFTPVRDHVDQQWAEVEDLMTLCEQGVNMDAETALGFQDWIGHLSDPTMQTHAKIYLDLIDTRSPLMAHGIGELIKLFRPEDGSWAELRSIKDVFDQVALDAEFDMH